MTLSPGIILYTFYIHEHLYNMDTAVRLQEILTKSEKMFGTDPQISSYERSLQEFKKMVASGITTPRGYNIRTVEHGMISVQFNK